jgi:hypothetical protein
MYLIKVPKIIPIPGKIVQHNFPPGNKRRKLGAGGFRAFLYVPDATKKVCNCSWAPHLGYHYTTYRKSMFDPAEVAIAEEGNG